MEKSVQSFIRYVGDNPEREGLLETPARVLRAIPELFSGYIDEEKKLNVLFSRVFSSDNDSMVIQKNIPVHSFCEHHILPFFGFCDLGYIPKGKVIGASKLTRIVDIFSRRLQIQEQLTEQIGQAIFKRLDCAGVIVVLRCLHLCMVYRGIKSGQTPLITSKVLGVFADDSGTRAEFLNLVEKERSFL